MLLLATRAGNMELSCPLGTTCLVPQETFSQKPYDKSFIDQANVRSRWLDICLVLFFYVLADLDSVLVHKFAKKRTMISSPTSLVNNPYVLPKNTLTQCQTHGQPGLEPGPLDQELSVLTTRPLHLHIISG